MKEGRRDNQYNLFILLLACLYYNNKYPRKKGRKKEEGAKEGRKEGLTYRRK